MIDKNKLPDPDLLTNDEIAELLPLLGPLSKWIENLQAYALSKALEGENFKGYKVVAGRSNRAFSDEEKALNTLHAAGYDDAVLYERKLLSLSKLEALVGKKDFKEILGELIIRPEGKPTLVAESDPREPYSLNSAKDDFGEDIAE